MSKKILVIRFSAMGDVAISAPLVMEYARRNSQADFYMLSQPRYQAMFEPVGLSAAENILNLHYIGASTNRSSKEYCGSVAGLWKLSGRLIKEFGITDIADIHGVLRSRILSLFLIVRSAFKGRRVRRKEIDKHRAERRALCRQKGKILTPITPSQRCMEEVFAALGLQDLHFAEIVRQVAEKGAAAPQKIFRIGIAPFAGHKGKEYPAPLMEEVIKRLTLSKKEGEAPLPQVKIFLYGGGKRETEIMQKWAEIYPDTHLMAGNHSLKEELQSMQQLDIMLSMDSANMHLASLVGTRVLSVWGATHPFAGFNGYGQPLSSAIQATLPCRPCSIYGAKPCTQGNYPCLYAISPQEIVNRLVRSLSSL